MKLYKHFLCSFLFNILMIFGAFIFFFFSKEFYKVAWICIELLTTNISGSSSYSNVLNINP